MFLRITGLLLLLMVFSLEAGIYEVPGHDIKSYEADTEILRKKIRKEPSVPEHRKNLILFLMSIEKFDDAVKEADIHLAKDSDQEIEYCRIIALASSSQYDKADNALRKYINKYKHSKEERKLLNDRRRMYKRALETKGELLGLDIVSDEEEVLGVDKSKAALITYNRRLKTVMLRSLFDAKSAGRLTLPKNTYYDDIINISISSNGKSVLASFRKGSKAVIKESSFDRGWKDWTESKELNEGDLNSYPCFIKGSSEILFVSNRKGSSGLDVYYSKKTRSGWSKPKSVEGANTISDEASVFATGDSDLVFVSSNGRPGLGGFDIYSGVLNLDSTPSIAINRNVVYINSYRNEVAPPYYDIKESQFFVTHKNADRTIIYKADKLWKDAIKYEPVKEPEIKEPEVKMPETGKLVAHDLRFDTGSAYIRPSSYKFLEQLVKYMRDNPHKIVVIDGHTDNVGTEDFNIKLSLERAESVAKYLERNGIPRERIKTNGYGTSKNIDTNSTEEGRQRNRRVEISFIDKVSK